MSVVDAARAFYEADVRVLLEANHYGEFVAIEPESRTYYVAKTFVEAAMAAKATFPSRKPFVIRIGHKAAFHIGAVSK